MSERQAEGTANIELVPSVDAADVPVIYANFFQATASPLDVTFHLGWYAIPPLIEQPTETVKVNVRPVMKISLPLGLLPGIIQVLQAQLETWQSTFGQPAQTPEAGTPE